MYDNKNYEAWFKNLEIQKEFDEYRRSGEKLRKDYDRYCNFVNKIEDNDKCSPHCAKKCINECHKDKTKQSNNKVKAIVIIETKPNGETLRRIEKELK